MRFSNLFILGATLVGVAHATSYDLDDFDARGVGSAFNPDDEFVSRDFWDFEEEVASRDIYEEDDVYLSRRELELDTAELLAAREIIDTILERRLFGIGKKKPTEPATPGIDQKTASAELQKWNSGVSSIRAALADLLKKNPDWNPKAPSRRLHMQMKECLGFNEEGAHHFRAIAKGENDPPAINRKPTGPICTYEGGKFSGGPAKKHFLP